MAKRNVADLFAEGVADRGVHVAIRQALTLLRARVRVVEAFAMAITRGGQCNEVAPLARSYLSG